MSNAVYPIDALAGLGIKVQKSPSFSTLIQRAVSGHEYRYGQMVYPIWDMVLSYNFLRDVAAYDELRTLVAFFLNRRAALDSFLLSDPDDNTATTQTIGTGNGTNRDFQLVRSFGGFLEPVYYPNSITNVQVNGVGAGYVLQSNGVVRMNTAPANGATVRWNGTYYFRCRFLEDKMSLEKFLHQVWMLGKLPMVGSLQDKFL